MMFQFWPILMEKNAFKVEVTLYSFVVMFYDCKVLIFFARGNITMYWKQKPEINWENLKSLNIIIVAGLK